MPMWQVQLPEWNGGNIRAVLPIEVLVEFEQPLTFTFQDDYGTLLLAHLLSQDHNTSRYVAAPTNDEIIDQLKLGARSIRTALDQPSIYVIDLQPNGSLEKAWVGNLKKLPARVLPASDVMLYADLVPMIRLRATGPLIEPGSLPARVVRSLVGGAEKAVRLLTNHVTGERKPGRPAESHRSLYQLQAQQFAFRSFEVAFRPVDPASGQLILNQEAIDVVSEVERLLSLGLQWAQTGEMDLKNVAERAAVLEAVRELSPSQGSPVERVEVSGRVVSDSDTNHVPILSKSTRQLAGSAIGALHKGRAVPEYVIKVGRVEAVDRGKWTVTVRNPPNEDTTLVFEEEYLDFVLDALQTQVFVNVVARQIKQELLLISAAVLDDSSIDELKEETTGFS